MKRGSEFRHYRLRVRVRVRIYRLEPHFSVAGGACVHSRSGAQGKWQRESLQHGGQAFAAQIRQRIRLAEATATFGPAVARARGRGRRRRG